MAEPDIFKNEIEITHKGETFVFKIPSIADEMRIAGRARAMRRAADADGDGGEYGLTNEALYMVRAAAAFETVLLKTSATWVFTDGKSGPVVDSSKFPLNKIGDVTTIYLEFQEKVATFVTAGLSTETRLARKLWRISQIIPGMTPFSEELTRLNEAQLDFMLEMYALDNPERMKFLRPGEQAPVAQSERNAAWERVLLGAAHEQFMAKHTGGMLAKLAAYINMPGYKNVMGFLKQAPKAKP